MFFCPSFAFDYSVSPHSASLLPTDPILSLPESFRLLHTHRYPVFTPPVRIPSGKMISSPLATRICSVQSYPTVARRHNWRRPHPPRPCRLSLALDTALDHVRHAPRLPTPLPVLASPSAGHYHAIGTPDDQHDRDATSPGAHPKQYAQPAVHPGSSTPHLLLVHYRSTIAPTPHARASRAPRIHPTLPARPALAAPPLIQSCMRTSSRHRASPSLDARASVEPHLDRTRPVPLVRHFSHRLPTSVARRHLNQRDAGGHEYAARCPHCRSAPSPASSTHGALRSRSFGTQPLCCCRNTRIVLETFVPT
jgi:hypothetical protein